MFGLVLKHRTHPASPRNECVWQRVTTHLTPSTFNVFSWLVLKRTLFHHHRDSRDGVEAVFEAEVVLDLRVTSGVGGTLNANELRELTNRIREQLIRESQTGNTRRGGR